MLLALVPKLTNSSCGSTDSCVPVSRGSENCNSTPDLGNEKFDSGASTVILDTLSNPAHATGL